MHGIEYSLETLLMASGLACAGVVGVLIKVAVDARIEEEEKRRASETPRRAEPRGLSQS